MALDRREDAVFMHNDGGHDPPSEGESSCLLLDVSSTDIFICTIVSEAGLCAHERRTGLGSMIHACLPKEEAYRVQLNNVQSTCLKDIRRLLNLLQ